MIQKYLHIRKFRTLDVEVYRPTSGPLDVTLSQKQDGWKYFIPIWANHKTVAKDLRRIADWIEKL